MSQGQNDVRSEMISYLLDVIEGTQKNLLI